MTCPHLRRQKRLLRLAPLAAAALTLLCAPWVQAQGNRPEPARSPLTRYIPTEDLIFYGEFDGLDNHTESWHKSAAYKILTETTLGALIEDLVAQGFEAARDGDDAKPKGTEVVAFIKQAARNGVALGFHAKPPEAPRTMWVFRNGNRPDSRKFIDRFAESLVNGNKKRETVNQAGRKVLRLGVAPQSIMLWSEHEDVILCQEADVERVVAALSRPDANVGSNRLYTELKQDDAGFHPIGLGFMDLSKLPAPPPDVVKLGIDGLKRMDFRVGFKGDALMTVSQVVAPSPRRGILALMDQPKFSLSSLLPIPANQTAFTVGSINLASTYDQIVALTKLTNPQAANQLDALETQLNQILGVKLRNDVLERLGPQWAVDMRPAGRPAGTPSIPFVDWTVTIQVKDAEAFAKSLEPLMAAINRQLAQLNLGGGPAGPVSLQFRKIEGPQTSYAMEIPDRLFPPGPMSALKPTLILGKNELVLAGRTETAQAAVALAGKPEGRWKPTGPFIPMARELPPGLILLNVNDPRETFPTMVASLPMLVAQVKATIAAAEARARAAGNGRGPADRQIQIQINPDLIPAGDELVRHLFPGSFAVAVDDQGIQVVTRDSLPTSTSPAVGGVAVGLLLPAVQAAREAARRAQCVNNLKQIGLAFLNYESTHGSLPKAAITDKQGKPLLSWRVAILPYLEQQELYEKFKLDEPWDSPHNRELLSAIPPMFACPSAVRKDLTTTNYRVFVGPGTAFEGKEGTKLSEVIDGTSNTLAVVETKEGVPWTKPEELEFDPKQPAPLFGAGSSHAGGFNALFLDGSVRFLKLVIDPKTLQALITRAGQEVIQADSY